MKNGENVELWSLDEATAVAAAKQILLAACSRGEIVGNLTAWLEELRAEENSSLDGQAQWEQSFE